MKKLLLLVVTVLLMVMVAAAPLSAEEITPDATGSKLIALTFDDGPGKYTDQLLDAFAEKDVKATFFVVGSNAARYPDIIRRQYNEGHQIANHTWNHPQLTSLSVARIQNELYSTEDAIDNALGFDIGRLMLRPPYGAHNATVRSAANVPIIYWSVDTLDWKNRNATTVKNRIINGASDGAIILLHDIHSTTVQGTIAAIDELKNQGFTFVTVAELFSRKGITMENGVLYKSAPANGVDLGPVDPYAYDETRLHEHWGYEYICYAKDNGLMIGLSEDKFGPNYPMTRAMFATVLSRLSGESMSGYENPFTDVPAGEWYTDAISWAAAKGVVNGHGDGTFAPDDEVTREESAVMIANFLRYYGMDNSNEVLVSFSDQDKISSWAAKSVTIVVNKGIMNGVGNNVFDPQGTATRAQAATLLTKVHKLMQNTPAMLHTIAAESE
ncbi:MAG: S-layer homology domain-containing protein [Firmicutes bacterium]|nr:S-layer homology domain-containing protein [Bacillota bacterium]